MESAAPLGTIAVKNFPKNRITFDKELGSGTFGKVFKATVRDWKGPVAVKVFYQEFIGLLPNVDSKLRASAFDELAKVAVMNHENIVTLLGMVDDNIPWLVFEYMKDGNLLEYVLRRQAPTEKTLISFCRDICRGMSFLHRNNFLHKDLAARNILLDGKVAKIADLGLCSLLSEEQHGSYALNGKLFPYRHAASECIIENIFTFESDVWSFGVLMFEIFTNGAVPYGKGHKQPEVRRFIADGKNPTHFYPPLCSDDILVIMRSTLRPNRKERPTFDDLYSAFNSIITNGKGKLHKIFSRQNALASVRSVQSDNSRESLDGKRSSKQNFTQALQIPGQSLHNRNYFASNPDIRVPNSCSSQSESPPSGPFGVPPPRTSRLRTIKKESQEHSRNVLSVSPTSGGGEYLTERRNSDVISASTSGSRPSHSTRHVHLGATLSNPPRRTASFNNIPKPDSFHKAVSDEDLMKDFVPNRFKTKH